MLRFSSAPPWAQKTAPASSFGNRGGSLALFVLFQALTQLLAGVLDRSLSGCQNYRAFGFTIFRYLKSFQLTFTTFCLFSPSWGHKRYLQYFHWFNTVPIIPAFKQSLDSDHAAMLVSRYNLLPTECWFQYGKNGFQFEVDLLMSIVLLLCNPTHLCFYMS